jgi:outer membrane biosynthesis protein TonB
VLRKAASRLVVPLFPRESLHARHQGVAVAEVTFGTTGKIERVDVLDAPDTWILAAMLDAVRRWELPSATHGSHPVSLTGKLTYYFLIRGGVGVVMDPTQTFFVGSVRSRRLGTIR